MFASHPVFSNPPQNPIGLKRWRGRRDGLCPISPALYEYLMSPATPTADDAAEAEFMMSSLLLKSVSATRRTPVDLPLALSELTYKKRENNLSMGKLVSFILIHCTVRV